MDQSENDKTFADLDLTVQEFRKLGHGVIDIVIPLRQCGQSADVWQ